MHASTSKRDKSGPDKSCFQLFAETTHHDLVESLPIASRIAFLDSDNREAEANVIIFRMHSVAIWYRFISKFVVARFAISGPKAARRSNRLDHDKMTLLFGFLRRAHESHEINDTAPFGC